MFCYKVIDKVPQPVGVTARIAMLTLLLIVVPGKAESSTEKAQSVRDYFAAQGLAELQTLNYYSNFHLYTQINPAGARDIYEVKSKSVGKAFIYSFLVPGLGEYYSGSRIKPFIFFGVEIASWAGYLAFRSHGISLRKDFQVFADARWSESAYRDWLFSECGTRSDLDSCVHPDGSISYWTHHLPAEKNHEYYENIGKYDQFFAGWVAVGIDSATAKSNRTFYLNQRFLSNRAFNRARALAVVSIANHLLSAFDAAISARKFNKKADRLSAVSFQMRLATNTPNIIPVVRMTYRF